LFWGETASERVRKVREAEIPPLEKLRPSLPPALLAIIARALARSPTERFETAEAMHDALLRCLLDQPVSPRELAQATIDIRVASGLSPRSIRPPSIPSPSNDVVTRKIMMVKPSAKTG
jgi:serine/threonine protein kinase